MNNNISKINILFVFLVFMVQPAFAWTQTPTVYYNNWNNSKIITDLELDVSNPDYYTYSVSANASHLIFQKNDDTLVLPRSIIDTVNTYPDRISFNISTTKADVVAKSVANGTGQRYINIPNSVLKLRFIFDNLKPTVLIDNGTNQWYADPSTYWYSNIGGQIRFNFETTPYASLASTDSITFIFNSWVVDDAIISGLTDVGGYSSPTIFTNDSKTYLISGRTTGQPLGFNYTGSTWQSDTAIISGLPSAGIKSSIPSVFNYNSNLYLVLGNDTGDLRGYNWTGSAWQSDAGIISGLVDPGFNSAPYGFIDNSTLYMIIGNSSGFFMGYNYTGSTWQSDNAIVSGLPDIGSYAKATIFENNSVRYLITGNGSGMFTGFNWTGEEWQSDNAIVSGLPDIGLNSVADTFINDSKIYFISGNSTGLWTGFNMTYFNETSSSTFIPPVPVINSTIMGNFYINTTWNAGVGNVTDSYNSTNGTVWINNTLPYRNTTLSAHAWQNLTVYAYNSSDIGTLSLTSLTNNTQIPNNVPIQNAIGDKSVNEGELLTFTITSSDLDNDLLTYASNNTKGTLTSNSFSWTPDYTDSGVYHWIFNTTDNYSAVTTETITVTVYNIDFIPPVPTMNSSVTGNFYVNQSWVVGIGNVTDSYNVSQNGTWSNGSSITYKNTTVGAHGWSNITVYAWNNSYDNLSVSALTNNTQVPNNPIIISDINTSYVINEGETLTIDANYIDADSDTGTFDDNSTQWNVNSNGIVSWSTGFSDAGVYNWYINVTDGYGSISTSTFIVTVNNILQYPGTPIIDTVTMGNFYINTTWTTGIGNVTDSYNSTNGTIWINNTLPYRNTTLSAHAWQNLTIYAYNSTDNTLSSALINNSQISNNPIIISDVNLSYVINEGQTLSIDANYTDADSDTGIFDDNATQWSVNNSTGIVSWITGYSDAGIYDWYINVTDGYGSTSTQAFNVTITNVPQNFIPPSPINLTNTTGNFWVNYSWSNGSGNITDSYNVSHNGTWTNGTTATFMNNTVGENNWSNISIYSYNNTGTGSLNLTPISMNTKSITSNITILTYNISGQVLTGGLPVTSALVSYSGGTNTTNSTGHYNFSSVSNGTYSFTISKSGYDNNVSNVTVNGSDVSQNFTLTLTPSTSTSGGGGGGGGSWSPEELIKNIMGKTNMPAVRAYVNNTTMQIYILNEGTVKQEYVIYYNVREDPNGAVAFVETESKMIEPNKTYVITRKLDLKDGNYVLKAIVEYGMQKSESTAYFTIAPPRSMTEKFMSFSTYVIIFIVVSILIIILKNRRWPKKGYVEHVQRKLRNS
ncbi:MAG: carboxypeptidase regulatory-like domain-containing protein [Candidatus Methanoperedens sp.]|nr:carboxypeptidase regulatory-like domain-containing protein [Candidatus Methanoperedens sp.]CAG0948655.1 hypothetical protein METP1_00045 [Methanosarcinales archaeon]